MGNTYAEVRPQSRLRTLYYWTLLLAALVVVDDLTFGWIFWLVAQVHPVLAFFAAFAIYWSLGFWITLRGLAPQPGKIAGWLLNRLNIERRPELQSREDQLKNRITSVTVAVPMSLLFGGVVTTLWLRHKNIVDDRQAKRLAFVLCGLYAVEFGLIHAFGIGGSIFFVRQ